MKLLFVGESWRGSSARSMKEALHRTVGTSDPPAEVNEDLFIPKAAARPLRLVNRILGAAYRRELARAIIAQCHNDQPDVLVVYKGSSISGGLIREIRARGIFAVNIFPDYSPHVYGTRLRDALGNYDLVISTKPFHPSMWASSYKYRNECVFVPHGYDPELHLWSEPAAQFDFDVGLVATWRPEYHNLMLELAQRLPSGIEVAIAGSGWSERQRHFPSHWVLPGVISGVAYPRWARRCKIMLAPVNTDVVVDGVRQPGDEDTSRTYELAAASCFFIHRRTNYVSRLYDEEVEVPFFDNAADLAALIQEFLPREAKRLEMAAAAHRRAVPAYSTDARAREVLKLLKTRSLDRKTTRQVASGELGRAS